MANINIDNRRNKKLINLLIRLSDPALNLQNAGIRRDIYSEFENIYWLGQDKGLYRHLYSDLFDTITSIDNSPINDIEILVQNIRMLCTNYDSKNSKIEGLNIGDSLIKLYDHISLDVRRLQYTKSLNYQHQGELFSVANKIKETEKNIDVKITNAIENTKESYEKQLDVTKNDIITKNNEELVRMRAEYISILGIFASIVLAFTGGMVFSSSVLDNIYKSSIYRTIIVVSLIGMVFIAMIWLLLDFIRNIHDQQKRNWWFIVVPESVLAIMIVFSVISYNCNWFSGEEKITYSVYENNTEYEEYESIE